MDRSLLDCALLMGSHFVVHFQPNINKLHICPSVLIFYFYELIHSFINIEPPKDVKITFAMYSDIIQPERTSEDKIPGHRTMDECFNFLHFHLCCHNIHMAD